MASSREGIGVPTPAWVDSDTEEELEEGFETSFLLLQPPASTNACADPHVVSLDSDSSSGDTALDHGVGGARGNQSPDPPLQMLQSCLFVRNGSSESAEQEGVARTDTSIQGSVPSRGNAGGSVGREVGVPERCRNDSVSDTQDTSFSESSSDPCISSDAVSVSVTPSGVESRPQTALSPVGSSVMTVTTHTIRRFTDLPPTSPDPPTFRAPKPAPVPAPIYVRHQSEPQLHPTTVSPLSTIRGEGDTGEGERDEGDADGWAGLSRDCERQAQSAREAILQSSMLHRILQHGPRVDATQSDGGVTGVKAGSSESLSVTVEPEMCVMEGSTEGSYSGGSAFSDRTPESSGDMVPQRDKEGGGTQEDTPEKLIRSLRMSFFGEPSLLSFGGVSHYSCRSECNTGKPPIPPMGPHTKAILMSMDRLRREKAFAEVMESKRQRQWPWTAGRTTPLEEPDPLLRWNQWEVEQERRMEGADTVTKPPVPTHNRRKASNPLFYGTEVPRVRNTVGWSGSVVEKTVVKASLALIPSAAATLVGWGMPGALWDTDTPEYLEAVLHWRLLSVVLLVAGLTGLLIHVTFRCFETLTPMRGKACATFLLALWDHSAPTGSSPSRVRQAQKHMVHQGRYAYYHSTRASIKALRGRKLFTSHHGRVVLLKRLVVDHHLALGVLWGLVFGDVSVRAVQGLLGDHPNVGVVCFVVLAPLYVSVPSLLRLCHFWAHREGSHGESAVAGFMFTFTVGTVVDIRTYGTDIHLDYLWIVLAYGPCIIIPLMFWVFLLVQGALYPFIHRRLTIQGCPYPSDSIATHVGASLMYGVLAAVYHAESCIVLFLIPVVIVGAHRFGFSVIGGWGLPGSPFRMLETTHRVLAVSCTCALMMVLTVGGTDGLLLGDDRLSLVTGIGLFYDTHLRDSLESMSGVVAVVDFLWQPERRAYLILLCALLFLFDITAMIYARRRVHRLMATLESNMESIRLYAHLKRISRPPPGSGSVSGASTARRRSLIHFSPSTRHPSENTEGVPFRNLGPTKGSEGSSVGQREGAGGRPGGRARKTQIGRGMHRTKTTTSGDLVGEMRILDSRQPHRRKQNRKRRHSDLPGPARRGSLLSNHVYSGVVEGEGGDTHSHRRGRTRATRGHPSPAVTPKTSARTHTGAKTPQRQAPLPQSVMEDV
ncbi:hypothetical protein KIPB_002126 [Kipferlia bialata]|uniref:Transmembrane protein n=1 Tax=Kipferlia bialata TaxID=797122 RepID=A0A9K3CS77_9EUKA|nr:hypothetical protein KIPB_002126 [Kipferlia bialata]|eukprot:g2126.t1